MAAPPAFRVAVVGTGWIGAEHIDLLTRLGQRPVAVCDVERERAERAAPDGARVYDDWGELLEREELDAVWVATPPLHHAGPAVTALERGIPVYLEKPIARTLDDAATIVATAERTGTVCAVGYQWHGTEALEVLRRELEGNLVALVVARSVGPTASRPWFVDRAGGGGNILERGSHQIDLARAVAGEVVRVHTVASGVPLAQSGGSEGDIEDAATMLLEFESGALGTLVVGWTRPGQPGFYSLDVAAADATLQLELDPAFALSGRARGGAVEHVDSVHPLERTARRFLQAVEARDPDRVFCSPRDAAGTLAVALACERSLLERRTVDVVELTAPAA